MRLTLSKEVAPMPLVPSGALTVKLVKARNFIAQDRYIGGSGKSDPYAIISCGERKVSFKDQYVAESLNPTWNYEATFAIENPEGHTIGIEVYDHDKMANDDFLGQLELSVEDSIKHRRFDKWVKLKGVES